MKNLDPVIKRPIITEKSAAAVAQNKYTFEVDRRASKGEIERAVEKLFKVTVLEVETANVKGEESDWKKAVVTVKEGDKIELFEVGG